MPELGEYLKSLKPFKGILESFEAQYWSSFDDRDGTIDQIMSNIWEAAKKKGMTVASDNTLQKVCRFLALLYGS